MPTPPIPILIDTTIGIEVSVSRIDHELRMLWEQDQARSNAALINLVVYSEKPNALAENSVIIRNLTRDHACRAILVELDRHQKTQCVRAWITAHCHLSHGLKSVCCEQIALHFTGHAKGRMRNTVFAHLNADLPVVFWWQGVLSTVFDERLASAIDRLIFDSAKWPDAIETFQFLREVHAGSTGRMILQDLAWSRIWHFRQGLARLFDDPVAQSAIPSIQNIEIRHHPNYLHSAILMISWLAHQAGWQVDQIANLTHQNGTKITYSLIPDSSATVIESINIHAGHSQIRVTRKPGCSHFHGTVTAPNGHEVKTVTPADPNACQDLVAEQLSRGGRNSIYQSMLPNFLTILQNQQNQTPQSS